MTNAAATALRPIHHADQLPRLESGMREASMAYVRAHYDELPRPVAAIYHDGTVALQDGRHRLAVARERGELWVDVDFVVYTRSLRVACRFERRLTVRGAA